MVRRRPDPRDRRTALVEVAPAGEAVLGRLAAYSLKELRTEGPALGSGPPALDSGTRVTGRAYQQEGRRRRVAEGAPERPRADRGALRRARYEWVQPGGASGVPRRSWPTWSGRAGLSRPRRDLLGGQSSGPPAGEVAV